MSGTWLISGALTPAGHVVRLYDAGDRLVASEPSPGAGLKLQALAFEAGAAKVLHLYDRRKDEP